MIKYGLTQQDMHEYRSAFKTACECTAGIPEAKSRLVRILHGPNGPNLPHTQGNVC